MAAKALPVPRTTAMTSATKSGVFMAKLATTPEPCHRLIGAQINAL
jgi:hypothetical protein